MDDDTRAFLASQPPGLRSGMCAHLLGVTTALAAAAAGGSDAGVAHALAAADLQATLAALMAQRPASAGAPSPPPSRLPPPPLLPFPAPATGPVVDPAVLAGLEAIIARQPAPRHRRRGGRPAGAAVPAGAWETTVTAADAWATVTAAAPAVDAAEAEATAAAAAASLLGGAAAHPKLARKVARWSSRASGGGAADGATPLAPRPQPRAEYAPLPPPPPPPPPSTTTTTPSWLGLQAATPGAMMGGAAALHDAGVAHTATVAAWAAHPPPQPTTSARPSGGAAARPALPARRPATKRPAPGGAAAAATPPPPAKAPHVVKAEAAVPPPPLPRSPWEQPDVGGAALDQPDPAFGGRGGRAGPSGRQGGGVALHRRRRLTTAGRATTAAPAGRHPDISRADLEGAARQLEQVLGIPLVVREGADGGITVWEPRRSGRRGTG